MIRHDLLSSRSLSRVSWQADWLFHKLLLAADEFGRLDGRLEVIRAECFPSRPDVTMVEIERWLAQLESCDPDGRGPVRRYEVDGWPYIQLVNWEKHRAKRNRAESSRFPDPPQLSAEFSGEKRSEAENVGLGLGVWGSGGQGVKVASATPSGSAAQFPLAFEPPEKPPKPKRRAPAKPSSRAIAIYSEEFKTAIGVNPAIPERDFRELGAALDQVGEERFRSALVKYFEFGESDEWIKKQGYSSREFLRQFTKCDLHAQKTRNRPRLVEQPEVEEDPVAFFGAQFTRVAL